jgi:cytochrome c oxidase subunit 1
VSLPRIRSESPAFDLHHPELAALEIMYNPGETEEIADAPDVEGRSEAIGEAKVDDE